MTEMFLGIYIYIYNTKLDCRIHPHREAFFLGAFYSLAFSGRNVVTARNNHDTDVTI